jgi:processive 1,2-diacylglycerol beta-glucosyltransferase
MFKILLLSVSAGAGHVRAAQALAAAAANASAVETRHVDVLTVVPSTFRKIYSDFYLKLVERHPRVWSYLYDKTDRTPPTAWFSRMRRAVERLNTRKLKDVIEEYAPDCIVCTHFLPAELLARRIARGAALPPVWVQVTDFDLHRLWVHAGLDGYLVANDEVAFRLASYLPDQQHVVVAGIPIQPAFAKPWDRSECARELGLNPDKTTLLVMTGGAGIASGAAMVERLLAMDGDFQIVALAGRNEALLARYRELAAQQPQRMFPLGFTTTVERVMACADIAVTKPGGLSTSECLAMGLPMILIAPIPGQEERNADYLVEQGAALLALDTIALEFRARLLLGDAPRRAAMRERCLAIRRPQAAGEAVAQILAVGPRRAAGTL